MRSDSAAFDADWLDLREAADHAARSRAGIEQSLPPRSRRRILDLGAGTGSNCRYLAPRLGGDQQWWLLDADPRLLVAAAGRFAHWAARQGFGCRIDGREVEPPSTSLLQASPGPASSLPTFPLPARSRRWSRIDLEGPGWKASVEPRRVDLADAGFPGSVMASGHPLDGIGAGDEAIDLVTASALLDLVSAAWLVRLVDWCVSCRSAMLFALSYVGHIEWSPAHPDDATMTRAMELDQRRDKGLGVALGSDAVARLRSRLAVRGYLDAAAPSDWILGANDADAEIQRRLIDDLAGLATQAGADGKLGPAWRAARLAALDAGTSSLRVGHVDVAAWTR